MSVIIKGVEMPKGCSGCPIDSDSCTLWQELPPERLRDTRPTDSPLVPVPPHGRLIDADVLEEYLVNDPSCLTIFEAIKKLQGMPTIIQADKEGE